MIARGGFILAISKIWTVTCGKWSGTQDLKRKLLTKDLFFYVLSGYHPQCCAKRSLAPEGCHPKVMYRELSNKAAASKYTGIERSFDVLGSTTSQKENTKPV